MSTTKTNKMVRRFNFGQRRKGRQFNKDRYGLPREQWNESLKAEFNAYEQWRTAKINFDRPVRLRQRHSTFEGSISEFEAFFGFLVTYRHEDPATLQLAHVADPERVRAYIEWHSEHRVNGPSRFMEKSVGSFYRVARFHLEVSPDRWQELYKLRQAILPDDRRNKRERMIALSDLEQIGLAEQPSLTALREAATQHATVRLALQAQRSLLIRLVVCRPLRSRNIREMKLDENLYLQNKTWFIEFRGEQLKISRRNGRTNVYRAIFPKELVPQLEEFLTHWRPLLPGHARAEVFTTKTGRPFSAYALNAEFKKTVYAYTGRVMNIHLVRDVWANEYIAATHDVVTAAVILGDTVETVIRCYVDPYCDGADDKADRIVCKLSAEEEILSLTGM